MIISFTAHPGSLRATQELTALLQIANDNGLIDRYSVEGTPGLTTISWTASLLEHDIGVMIWGENPPMNIHKQMAETESLLVNEGERIMEIMKQRATK